MFWTRTSNPRIEVGIEDISYADTMYNMLEYDSLYVSEKTYLTKLYIGENGMIVLIPTGKDSIQNDAEEKDRIRSNLADIRETFGLDQCIYPIIVNTETAWYFTGTGIPEEIPDLESFLAGLHEETCYKRLLPYGAIGQVEHISKRGAVILENKVASQDADSDRKECDNKDCKTAEGNISVCETTDSDIAYEDTEIPERKLIPAVDPILLQQVINRIEERAGQGRPIAGVKTDASGTEWVYRDSDIRLAGINTGLIGRKAWYRVSEVRTERMIVAASLGGWLGVHYFILGNFLQGLLYLLTCGFGGILPAIDILMMTLGAFRYEETNYFFPGEGDKATNCREVGGGPIERIRSRVYLRKPKNPLACLLFLLLSLVIGRLTVHFIYRPLLELIGAGLGYLGNQLS